MEANSNISLIPIWDFEIQPLAEGWFVETSPGDEEHPWKSHIFVDKDGFMFRLRDHYQIRTAVEENGQGVFFKIKYLGSKVLQDDKTVHVYLIKPDASIKQVA